MFPKYAYVIKYTNKPTHTAHTPAHTCIHLNIHAYTCIPRHTAHTCLDTHAFACTYVDTHSYTCMHCPHLLSSIPPQRWGWGGPQDRCYRGLAQGPQEGSPALRCPNVRQLGPSLNLELDRWCLPWLGRPGLRPTCIHARTWSYSSASLPLACGLLSMVATACSFIHSANGIRHLFWCWVCDGIKKDRGLNGGPSKEYVHIPGNGE